MFHYWLYFKAQTSTGSSEHTRYLSMSESIDYATDIAEVQAYLAAQVGAKSAMLVSWTALRGDKRPDDNRAPLGDAAKHSDGH